MEKQTVKERVKPTVECMTRREFCNKAIKRSSLLTAAGITGYLVYKKPAIKSFFGTGNAYAATTGSGKFSLKGASN